MSDYIKREDAVRRIAVLIAAEAESDGYEDQPMENYIEYASEDLADIPSADVAPVRHGKWMKTGAYPHRVYCSVCSRTYAQAHWEVWKDGSLARAYCPNCGAKMDGGDTDA